MTKDDKLICEICGEPLTDGKIHMVYFHTKDKDMNLINGYGHEHVCSDCVNNINNYISNLEELSNGA